MNRVFWKVFVLLPQTKVCGPIVGTTPQPYQFSYGWIEMGGVSSGSNLESHIWVILGFLFIFKFYCIYFG